MKKLLELLGTITIASSAMLTVIAAAPNRKHNIKKRQNNEDISTTPKIQNEQQFQSSKNTDSQTDIIEKEINLDENYSENIQKMLQELIDEKYLDPLRSINMGGLISKELNNKTIISKLEELEPKMANWIKKWQNNKEKILILTLKNSNNKSIKLVINLNNLYLLGFVNNQNHYFYFDDELLEKIKQHNQEEITKLNNLKNKLNKLKENKFLFNEEKVKEYLQEKNKLIPLKEKEKNIKKLYYNNELNSLNKKLSNLQGENLKDDEEKIKTLNKSVIKKYNCQKINLNYTGAYTSDGLNVVIKENGKPDKGKNINISKDSLNDAISNLSNYDNNKQKNQTIIKDDLIRMIFITSEAMRFQCDEKTLEIFTKIKNIEGLKKIIDENKNILKDIQEKIFNKNKIINWKDYTSQLRGDWKKYSEQFNKFRIEIWEDLIKVKNINYFLDQNQDDINKIFEKENELEKILTAVEKLFDTPENEKYKKIKKNILEWLEDFVEIQIYTNAKINYGTKKDEIKEDEIKILDNKKERKKSIQKILEDNKNPNLKKIKIINGSSVENKMLNYCILTKNLDLAKLLIILNLFIKEINNSSIFSSPLHLAAGGRGQTEIVKLLLEHGVNVNLQDNNGLSPLHVAAIFSQIKALKLLLEHGVNVNLQDNNGNTPLHWITSNSDMEFIKELLTNENSKNKIDVNIGDNNGLSPLNVAAARGQTEIVKLLLEHGADIKATTKQGTTPLHVAAFAGHTEIVKELLKYPNIDVNAKNIINETPLYVATQNGQTEAVKELLTNENSKNKIDVNIGDNNGNTPLIAAAAEGQTEAVKELLTNENSKNKIDVNIGNNNGNTPLIAAAAEGQTEIVKLLLEHGASENATNKGGSTPLIAAAAKGQTEAVKELLTNENSKNKIDVNIGDNNGNTPLIAAAAEGQTEIVKLLLEHGASENATNKDGSTPLIAAAAEGQTEAVKELLTNENSKNKIDVNIGDNNGNTPLIAAAAEGQTEIVKLLLEHGASENATNKDGSTPLIAAAAEGQTEAVKELLTNENSKNKIDVNIGDNNGNTPLIAAAAEGQTEAVKELLTNENSKNKIDVNLANNYGNTPLIAAAAEGQTEAVKELLTNENSKNKIDVNIGNNNGNTPLIAATAEGHTEIVQELLTNENSKNKIDVNIGNNNGNTPLIAATAEGQTEIIKLLLANGANVNASDTNGLIPTGNDKVKKLLDEFKKSDKTTGPQKKDESGFGGFKPGFLNSSSKSNSNINTNSGGSQSQGSSSKRVSFGEQAGTSGTQNQNTKTTNQNNLYDVPADNSCLFWSVATSYLLSARNNNEEFRNRFIQLFGELQLSYLSYVQTLLQQFDLSNTNNFLQDWYQDATAHRLVRVVFRNRVVDYIERNLDNPIQSNSNGNQAESFRSAIQISENEVVNNYLDRMRNINAWGGEIEILAMNNLLNANIGVGTDIPYQPVHQNATNTIDIFHVELVEGSGIHNHYNFALTSEEDRTNHPIAIDENQGNVLVVVDTTNRQDNLPITTPKPDTNTIKLPVDYHAQHHAILSNNNDDDFNQGNNITNSQEKTATQLQKDEYHFLDKKIEDNSLKNDENLEINLIKNNNKINQNVPVVNKPINKNIINAQIIATKAINKYNALPKEEKQQKLTEINQHYQSLSENGKKAFKDKLTNTGLAALSGGALTAYGTKMTVSSTAATGVTNAEAMEMTPLLSTSTTESLAAAETITVAETAAVEGGIIAGETGTAAALAPETLGLSLVIGGLAIAGTWMYFAFHHHSTSDIALPASIHHNVYDNIEKWYKFLAHDKLKIKINKNTWNEIKQNKNSQATITKIIKNKFIINDHSGWGGSVTNEDFNTLVKVMLLHFEQINGYFEILDNENDGFVIITNTEGDWLGIE